MPSNTIPSTTHLRIDRARWPEDRSRDAEHGVFAPVEPLRAGAQRSRSPPSSSASTRWQASRRGRAGTASCSTGARPRRPAGGMSCCRARAAAQLVADEWNRQGEILKPGDMPLMRLVNTVIDGVASAMAEVRAEIVEFAGSDLLCYRADSPQVLVDLQSAEWDPVLDWSRDRAAGALLPGRRHRASSRSPSMPWQPSTGPSRSAVGVRRGRAVPARRAARHDDA